jgi:hypothetical protein
MLLRNLERPTFSVKSWCSSRNLILRKRKPVVQNNQLEMQKTLRLDEAQLFNEKYEQEIFHNR